MIDIMILVKFYLLGKCILYSFTIGQIELQVYNGNCENDHRWHCLTYVNLILHSTVLHLGNIILCKDLISLQETGNFAK